MEGGGGEVYSGVLNVSFHGNEILNFNREINRVFHSRSFPRQITCFFSEFSAEFERAAVSGRAHTVAFPSCERSTRNDWYPFAIGRSGEVFLGRWNVGRISGISRVFIKAAHL